MPPPVKEPITFLGWIEDLFKIPSNYPHETWAIVRKDYDNKIFVLRVNQLPSAMTGTSFSESDLISALLEGPESIADIKGVVSTITIKDLISSPVETVKKLGTSTFTQIMDLDELSSDRRADMLGRLTRGQITDGEDPNVPNSSYLDIGQYLGQKAFGVKKAGDLIDTTTATSRIQLLKDAANGLDPMGRGDWEDRKTLEENESRQNKWKSYSSLAGALTKLGGDLEDTTGRKAARNNVYKEYTRSVVREIGIDLEKVLGKSQSALSESGQALTNAEIGRLSKTLSTGTTIETILASDALTASVLGLSISDFGNYSPQEKAVLRSFLAIEDINIRRSFYNPIIHEPEDLMQKLKGNGNNYSTVFDKKDYAVGMKEQIPVGIPWVPAKPPSMQEQFTGYRDRSFFKADTNGIQDKNLIMAYAQTVNDYRYIRNGIRRDINTRYSTLTQAQRNSKIDRALARLDDAKRAAAIADDLFYVSTVKEILENIEQGSFLRAALQSSRLLDLIPGNKFKSGEDLANLLSTGRVRYVKDFVDFLGNSVPTMLGLKFGPKKEIKLGNLTLYKRKDVLNPLGKAINNATGIFDGHAYASWTYKDPAGNILDKQRFVRIKSVDAQGIFADFRVGDVPRQGDFSVHNILKQMETNGFWQGAGNSVPGLPAGLNSTELLADFTKLDNFYANLQMAANWCLANPDPAFAPMVPTNFRPYVIILREFGIVQVDQTTGIFILTNIDKIFDQKAIFDVHGRLLLEKLGDPARMGQSYLNIRDRWAFLKKIGASGVGKDLTTKYVGLLGTWNRFANFSRNYLYQNIIIGTQFGSALLDVPVIGTLLKMGGGEIGLLGVVNNWNWVKNSKEVGAIFKQLSSTGVTTDPILLAKIIGKNAASFAIKQMATGTAGKFVLKIAGSLLLQASNVLTGGLSWVLAAFGDVAWKFGKNALKLNFKRAWAEAKEAMEAKWEVVKKVIIYPLACACGCIIAPIGLIIIVIASQLANFSATGGGSQADLESKMVDVTKTSQASGNKINYTVTITNISGEASVDVTTINDRLSFTYPCDQGGANSNYTEGQPWISGVSGNFPKNEPKPVAKSLSYSYSVENTIEGTYFNTIEIAAVGESGRSAISSVSDNVGKGGCITCPTGWPFTEYKGNLAVTQGPHTSHPDSSHGRVEAVDIAPRGYVYNVNDGQKIIATHRGTVSFNISLTGYGNLAIVTSDGGYSTYYAHLNNFDGSIRSGDLVDAGTVLGIMGNIGNSTGTHLHYEFRLPSGNANYECLAGHKLKLESINGQSYIPKTIPVACYGSGSCNISVP